MRKLAAIFLVLGTTGAMAESVTTSEFQDNFLGKKFQWKHSSGVGGETIHNADGTMIYDTNGTVRNASWTFKDDTFCVNAGESDELCFTLVGNGDGFAAEDGSIAYTPLE